MSTSLASLIYVSMWYAEKVAEQINGGTLPTDAMIDMGMQIMREVSAKWITEFFLSVSSNKDLVINGFKKAGIMHALSVGFSHIKSLEVEDPFVSDSDS